MAPRRCETPALPKLLGFQILTNDKNRRRISLTEDTDTVYTRNSESLSQPVWLLFKASASRGKKKKGVKKKAKKTTPPQNPTKQEKKNKPLPTDTNKMKGRAAYASFAEIFLLND